VQVSCSTANHAVLKFHLQVGGAHGEDAGHVDLHVSAGADGKNAERRALEAAKHAGAHTNSPATYIQTHRRGATCSAC